MKVRITNIQRFSLQDGPGIRTTVFFKGCNLRCPWCANPENINYEIQEYMDENTKKIFGYDIELKELEKEILKDENYYKLNNGGVTFSGGEPLLQFNKIEELLINLKKKNINICIETALFVPTNIIDLALKYVDEFIIDIKILEKEEAKNILNGNVDDYYTNINKIFENKKDVIFRIPVTNEYTLNEYNKEKILEFLKLYKPKKVEIFKLHNLAEKKYKVLNKNMQVFENVEESEMKKFLDEIKNIKIYAEICKI